MTIIQILLLLATAYFMFLGCVRMLLAHQISRRAEGHSIVAALTPQDLPATRAQCYADAARAYAEAANAWLAAAAPWSVAAVLLLVLQLVTP